MLFISLQKLVSFSGKSKMADSNTGLKWFSFEPISNINPLSTKPMKWSDTFKQFVGCCRQIF